ncbi:MAG: cytochrome c peroxidase [Bacteroidota bacterium]
MKKLIFSLMVFAVFLCSFGEDKAVMALQQIERQFSQGMAKVEDEIQKLKTHIIGLENNKASIRKAQERIIQTRLAYKEIEFLLAYFDAYSIKKNINGAPLPSVEPNVPEVIRVAPSGLQVLDEMIFADEVFEEKAALIDLVEKLEKDFKEVRFFQSKVNLTHRHIFESIRQELVRVYTLGLTGFDTPGSVNSIPEAKAALHGAYDAFKAYLPLLQEKNVGQAILMDARMEYTLSYLDENTDFDTFDRLKFLKEHIDPQYEIFLSIHKTLGIEFIEETTDRPQAVNYHATSLFAPDFLNKGYFANQDLKNPLLEKRIALGQLLFFDPVLSKNNERACASCHLPEKAFTDGLSKSVAMNQKELLQRNSPTLINAVYAEKYFHDVREHRLEKQILHVLENPKEFNTNFVEVIEKLKKSTEYQDLFAEAYPEYPEYIVSTYSISDALATYVMSLTDFDSPFDKYVRGEQGVIDPAIARGHNLFMGKAPCGTCHFAPVLNGTVPPNYQESETEVLGIPSTKDTLNPKLDPDMGRYASKLPRDKADFYQFSFKTVTVRNVALTAPYMHNGVYDTLEEVLDFYNRGGGAGMGMDLPHQTLPFDNLDLTQQEQDDIVAFMKSLTGDLSKFDAPDFLPEFDGDEQLNARKIGGTY